MPDPAHLSATELTTLLRNKDISSLELTDHYIARIEASDASLNAVVVKDFERAREAALAADNASDKSGDKGGTNGQGAQGEQGQGKTTGHNGSPQTHTHKGIWVLDWLRRPLEPQFERGRAEDGTSTQARRGGGWVPAGLQRCSGRRFAI